MIYSLSLTYGGARKGTWQELGWNDFTPLNYSSARLLSLRLFVILPCFMTFRSELKEYILDNETCVTLIVIRLLLSVATYLFFCMLTCELSILCCLPRWCMWRAVQEWRGVSCSITVHMHSRLHRNNMPWVQHSSSLQQSCMVYALLHVMLARLLCTPSIGTICHMCFNVHAVHILSISQFYHICQFHIFKFVVS